MRGKRGRGRASAPSDGLVCAHGILWNCLIHRTVRQNYKRDSDCPLARCALSDGKRERSDLRSPNSNRMKRSKAVAYSKPSSQPIAAGCRPPALRDPRACARNAHARARPASTTVEHTWEQSPSALPQPHHRPHTLHTNMGTQINRVRSAVQRHRSPKSPTIPRISGRRPHRRA